MPADRARPRSRPRWIGRFAGALLALAGAGPVPAQTADPDELARRADAKAVEKAAREAELATIEARLAGESERRAALEKEVEGLRGDRAKLAAALIATADRAQASEGRIAAIEARLATLNGSEEALRRSLTARRGLIGEVLAALQRMGRRPPPAVLVRPEDVLDAIRSAMLLGAVLPDLKQETDVLAGDLAELVRLRDGIAAERVAIRTEFATLAAERQRLSALIDARGRREAAAALDARGAAEQAVALAAQARSLREFVERIEREIDAASRAAESARKAIATETREQRERLAALSLRDPARLAPQIPFAEARGLLAWPVAGSQSRGFGAADGVGGTTRGISVRTRAGAIVSAPSDAWVMYAGPFRSFGQLLILNAGGGYYLLLAGMTRIDVTLNQFVLAGEPLAVMGESAAAAESVVGAGNGEPVLYIEFRKDGVSIDPTPWWTKSQGEKVRG